MKVIVFVGIFVLIFSAGFVMSCKDSSTNPDPNHIVFPDTGVSYGKHIQPLFNLTCAFSGCHSGDTYDQFGFALDSYEDMTATQGIRIIIPKNGAASPLYLSLIGKAPGAQMPLDKPALNSNQIKGIKSWIDAGAPDN